MRIARGCRGRRRSSRGEDRDGEEIGRPGRVLGEDGSFEATLPHPSPRSRARAICQTGEYTLRDNDEVSQTLRAAARTLAVDKCADARIRLLGYVRIVYMRTNGDRVTRAGDMYDKRAIGKRDDLQEAALSRSVNVTNELSEGAREFVFFFWKTA